LGAQDGDATLIDGINGALTDPFGGGLMGVTAENVARRHGIDRARQDAYAVESHRRAARALANGHFDGQITPVAVTERRQTRMFTVDEHVRPDASLEDMASLRLFLMRRAR
jgi:acetyl-CoA C-acetyltransferase